MTAPRQRRQQASPVARRAAEQSGVSLDGLAGSGPGGRILKRDVLGIARAMESPANSPSLPAAGAPAPARGWAGHPGGLDAVTGEDRRGWLADMMLIRRFEEEAGRQYARARIGGFLHLAIGEEACIVGAARALEARDYLIGTYRTHGHALARGSHPRAVMAELFGRRDGLCRGHGGSMHMYDASRRMMGGYGIVGGSIPIAAGLALSAKRRGEGEAVLCTFGDGAINNGTFGETANMAALWGLPIVFMVQNNQYGMGTALHRHSAVTGLLRRGEGYGIPGSACDGMDAGAVHAAVSEALAKARAGQPVLLEALTYRFRGHSMADPEEYRSKEEVAGWVQKDPIPAFAAGLALDDAEIAAMRAHAEAAVLDAVEFAEASPAPDPAELQDGVYAPTASALGALHAGWDRPPLPLKEQA